MNDSALYTDRQQRWQRIVVQVAEEYRNLPASEQQWLADRLQQIADLQGRLNRMFEEGDGLQVCTACNGECCVKGHNHMTLANLLAFVSAGELPPTADFSRTCPFLGDFGCLIGAERRPYNCISFVCDTIENSLTSEQIEEFYSLEGQLRSTYLEFVERYAGGGLTGLLLQSQRLGGSPFMELRPGRSDNG